MHVKGLGNIVPGCGLEWIEQGELFRQGENGVLGILTPTDKKVEFIVYNDKTLCYVKSAMDYPAIYPINQAQFDGPAEAVLMDLDGTSVHSEQFWMWIIEKTTALLTGNPKFELEDADEPYVSGHSVSEHLSYCIEKYCPEKSVEDARQLYFQIYDDEMDKIMKGSGQIDAFKPAPGLKEFLYTLKAAGIKIGLVTSGLYIKAWPEILSAFKTLGMGDPLDFYDVIISAGTALKKGQCGTIGELAPKPHPWLYAETARVGLGVKPSCNRVIGIEDSAAGVLSVRLAGFPVIGMSGGNIEKSGVASLCLCHYDNLCDMLPFLLGK